MLAQAIFVGKLKIEVLDAMAAAKRLDQVGQVGVISRFIECQVQHIVPVCAQRLGELRHRGEEGAQLLHVMPGVARLLVQLGNYIQGSAIALLEPVVLEVELIAEDKAQPVISRSRICRCHHNTG